MTVALADAARAAGVAVLRGNAPEERRVAGAGGLALHILDWGPAGGADVLMLHGFGQTAHTWDLCCAGLGAHLRLLSLDTDNHAFVLDQDKETIENAPGFDKDHWPETNDKNYHGNDSYWDDTNSYWGSFMGPNTGAMPYR